MNRITISFILVTVVLTMALTACSKHKEPRGANGKALKETDLEGVFQNPPEDAKPWVYWYWMQANATSDGITRDLEAMAQTGIGGAYLMPIGQAGTNTITDPPANPLSEHWWKLVVHATREADRLGLRLAMNACDGWALAGGPWIKPETSMQELVMSKRVVEGGKPFQGKLTQPTTRRDYYFDIAVLAYPSPEGTGATSTQLKPRATTNIPGLDPQLLVQGTEAPVNLSGEGWVQFEFEEPFTCRSITMSPDQRIALQLHRAELMVSSDGENFRSMGRLQPTQFHGWQDGGMACTQSIEAVTGRFFRFVFDKSGTPQLSENHEGSKMRNRDRLTAQHIELSSQAQIHQWEGKAGFRWRRSEWTSEAQCPVNLCVPLERIVDLTGKMDADGTLHWTPPPGRWTILRIACTTTDVSNRPGGTGVGLECDKFNPEAARLQFEGWFGEALDRVGSELAGRTLWRNHTDSWEAFSQNWSPLFRDEFVRRRGYDPLPWLPVMSGVPVGTAELSERFLYDIRRTIADLVCDNFYAPLVQAGRERGATFSAECIAPTMMADGLEHFKYADLPMGEFWLNSINQDKPNDIQDAICGGHTYGKKIIGAEAFTQNPITWNVDPYFLKPLGDYNFAKGINKFVLHVWAHQAFDREPGVTLNRVGTFFSSTQTWYKPGKAWVDYIKRCSGMLQQGLPVADACYFIGEEQPSRSYLPGDLPFPLPYGYAYDCINRDALLSRAKAKNGRIVMPDGVSYRFLVLPPADRMTPELAQKIGEIARAGVPVIGSRPTQSISLENYPICDEKVQEIVKKTWRSVRKGTTTPEVLEELGLMPDVEFIGEDMTPVYREKMEYFSAPFVWNHRQTGEADIYFLSNQERRPCTVEVGFRVADRVPELWDASTGMICDAGVWRQEKNRTIVRMNFAPSGSVFVVFRRKVDFDPVAIISPSLSDSGKELLPVWIENGSVWASENGTWELSCQSGKTDRLSMSKLPEPQDIDGIWKVAFTPGRGAPEQIELPILQSLTKHEMEGVKYFSGTATYDISFEWMGKEKEDRLFLDLGQVANLAEVTINGNQLSVLWKPPFIIEVTHAILTGRNELRIDVTNTWHNRFVGDANSQENKRIAWVLFEDTRFSTDVNLEPAGLIGPVRLRTMRRIK